MEDPEATKEEKDKLLDKQFYLLEKLMSDECPDVRSVAVEGLCRVFYLFWEVIPSPTITKVITKIFNDMAHESCSEVRLSTVNGITYLLANPQSHGILKVLLPRLGHLMLDSVTSVRVAMVDLLLLLRDVRTFQFNTVMRRGCVPFLFFLRSFSRVNDMISYLLLYAGSEFGCVVICACF